MQFDGYQNRIDFDGDFNIASLSTLARSGA
jgi:hypothetical protein